MLTGSEHWRGTRCSPTGEMHRRPGRSLFVAWRDRLGQRRGMRVGEALQSGRLKINADQTATLICEVGKARLSIVRRSFAIDVVRSIHASNTIRRANVLWSLTKPLGSGAAWRYPHASMDRTSRTTSTTPVYVVRWHKYRSICLPDCLRVLARIIRGV
jgi:hypothetical protein